MRCLLPLLLLPAWLGVNLPVQAEEFKSPKGFSLTCPDGWDVAPEEQLKKIAEETKKVIGTAPDFAVMIFGPRSDNFSATINVIVASGNVSLNTKNEKDIATAMQAQFGNGGKELPIKTGHITIDGKKAFGMALQKPRAKVAIAASPVRPYNARC